MSVSIFEAQKNPGGLAQSFYRQGIRFDVGHHLVNGFDEFNFLKEILHELDLSREIKFQVLSSFNHVYLNEKFQHTFKGNLELDRAGLITLFPKEVSAITNYFDEIMKIRKENYDFYHQENPILHYHPDFKTLFPMMHKFMDYDVYTYMQEKFVDSDLKILLTSNVGFFHTTTRKLSFVSYAIAQASFFNGGAVSIIGGGKSLIMALLKRFRQRGGKFHGQCKLVDFEVEGNLVTKAFIETKGNVVELTSKFFIANCSPVVVANLPAVASLKFYQRLKRYEYSTTTYIGFYRISNLNHYIPNYHSTIIDLNSEIDFQDYEKAEIAFTNYKIVDENCDGLVCLMLVSNKSMDNVTNTSEKENIKFKMNEGLRILTKGNEKQFELIEFSTPQTIERFTSNPMGAIYGYDLIVSQSNFNRISQETNFQNLFFCSSWVTPGPGFEFVVKGGEVCAKRVLGLVKLKNS